MPNKIAKNFAYNLALTLSGYLINLAIFPYITRVLGVDMIGRTAFATNTVGYFSLFAVLGVATVGVREISACGEDREKRSKVFSSILGLITLVTLAVVTIFLVCIFTVPRLAADKDLLIIGTASLFFTSLLVEWFYQGIENFKYVTLRTVAVKLVYAALIFILVHKPEDYLVYFALTVAAVVVNALINLVYSRRFVDFKFSYVELGRFAGPIFFLGLYCIMTSMYTTFNVIFLGFVQPEAEVGCYYTATKIYYILLGVLSAFTTVMLPRMSAILSEHKTDEFNEKLGMSFDIVFAFAFPLIAGGVVLAPQLVRILSGPGYEGAITPMRIVMPVILVTGCAQVWVTQALMPLRKDKVLLLCAVAGAIVGILANVAFVPSMGATGSALAVLTAELVANSISLTYAVRTGVLKFPVRKFLVSLVLSLPYFIICIVCSRLLPSFVTSLVVSVVACLAYFVIIHRFVLKDSAVGSLLVKWL